jgi:ATP-dependent protease HslVU (ClpYQ) peptidase subunit
LTLILGILCEDGVVMGADSEATMGSAGAGATTAQRTAKKLTIQLEKMIVGFSGFVGLSQRLLPAVESACKNRFSDRPETIAAKIRDALVPIVKPEYEMAHLVRTSTGNANVVQYAVAPGMIALPVQDKASLLWITETCAIEFATSQLPFLAIGSGQKDAETFLAFIRRSLWTSGKLPSVPDALFSAHWTIQHVIDINTGGGIGGAIQLISLTKDGGGWKAHELTEAEISVHRDAVTALGNTLSQWRAEFGGAPETPAPQPPPA